VVAKANKIHPPSQNFHQHHHTGINSQKKEHGLENHKDPYVTETEQSDSEYPRQDKHLL
jgi:hypothetical protein